MRKHALAALTVFAFVSAFSETALACQCVVPSQPPSPEEARAAQVKDFNGASAIFAGKVIEANSLKVKFKVEKHWKGDVGKEFVLSTGALQTEDGTVATNSCDYYFKLGEEYLVYAYPVDTDLHPGSTALQARECTRTRLLKNAKEDVEMLEQLHPVVRRSARSRTRRA